MAWSVDGQPVRLQGVESIAGEVERFEIDIMLPDGSAQEIEFEIDHDIFGDGFVGGLDVDGDDAIELVLATRRGPSRSRVVEMRAGAIDDR